MILLSAAFNGAVYRLRLLHHCPNHEMKLLRS